jgi:S-formylglutathione hydrolase FrmB
MKLFLTLLLSICLSAIYAQQGTLLESLKVKSAALGKDVEFSIYLPPDYDRSNRSYPILYLLHGYSDDETGWTQFGEVSAIADKTINTGDAPSMIIAMPDGGVSFYMNSYDGKERWEDFFINEFIPFIEKTYRVRAKSEFRAIAGLSMGGHGSMLMALKHTDLFTACAPLSGAFWTDKEVIDMPEDWWNGAFAQLFGQGLKGEARLNEHFRNNSPLKIIADANADDLKKLAYYIDCGDKDFLIKGNMALHAAMIDKAVPHEFRVREGVHDWTYWRTALPEVLKFVGNRFHR